MGVNVVMGAEGGWPRHDIASCWLSRAGEIWPREPEGTGGSGSLQDDQRTIEAPGGGAGRYHRVPGLARPPGTGERRDPDGGPRRPGARVIRAQAGIRPGPARARPARARPARPGPAWSGPL